jgi:hypothetical protein
MNFVNLLEETIAKLYWHDKTSRDVCFVGVLDTRDPSWPIKISMTWEEFKALAEGCWDEETGPGSSSLVIVGDTWWLERRETDDLRKVWDFKTKPSAHDYRRCKEPVPAEIVTATSSLSYETLVMEAKVRDDLGYRR